MKMQVAEREKAAESGRSPARSTLKTRARRQRKQRRAAGYPTQLHCLIRAHGANQNEWTWHWERQSSQANRIANDILEERASDNMNWATQELPEQFGLDLEIDTYDLDRSMDLTFKGSLDLSDMKKLASEETDVQKEIAKLYEELCDAVRPIAKIFYAACLDQEDGLSLTWNIEEGYEEIQGSARIPMGLWKEMGFDLEQDAHWYGRGNAQKIAEVARRIEPYLDLLHAEVALNWEKANISWKLGSSHYSNQQIEMTEEDDFAPLREAMTSELREKWKEITAAAWTSLRASYELGSNPEEACLDEPYIFDQDGMRTERGESMSKQMRHRWDKLARRSSAAVQAYMAKERKDLLA